MAASESCLLTGTELPQNVFQLADRSRVPSLCAHYDGRQVTKPASRLAIKTACMALWIMTAGGEDFASQDENAASGVHESSRVAIVTKIEEAFRAGRCQLFFIASTFGKTKERGGKRTR